jgi:hypothetical protein
MLNRSFQTTDGGGQGVISSCPQARTSRAAAKTNSRPLVGRFSEGRAFSLEGKQRVKHFDACESCDVRRGCRVRRAEGRLAVLDLGGGGINFPTPAAEACRGAFAEGHRDSSAMHAGHPTTQEVF